MIHYTCDLCGRSIGEERFVAKIEVAAGFDPEALTEDALEVDHLEEIAASIAAGDAINGVDLDESNPKTFQFDLCPSCTRHYLKSPLGPVRPTARLKYSQN